MPRRLPALRRRRTALRVGSAALAVLLLVPLSACSGDDDDKPSGDGESASAASQERGVATQATVGAVVGKLPADGRDRVANRVARVVDDWWDRAYVRGEFPRTSFSGAFEGFTPRAADRARADRNLLSNAGIGRRLTGVEAITRRVVVDVLAVDQRPVAATARVTLLMKLEGKGLDRRDRISGRVLLSVTNGAWRVFGYDLRRELIK